MQYLLQEKEDKDLVAHKEDAEPKIKFEKTIKALLDPVDVRLVNEFDPYRDSDYIVFKLNLKDVDNEILMILKSKGKIK